MQPKIYSESSAFPYTHGDDVAYGLTKREFIAIMVIQGAVNHDGLHRNLDAYAKSAIKAADALIAELNKDGEE